MSNPVFNGTGRALVVALLVVIGITAPFVAVVEGVFGLGSHGMFGAALVLTVSAPLATWAILGDERPPTRARRTKLAVALVTMAALALVAVLAVGQGLHALHAQVHLGTSARMVVVWFVLAVGSVLAIAATVCAMRWPGAWRRPLLGIGVASCVVAVCGTGAAATIVVTHTGCRVFRFDASRWRGAQQRRQDTPATMTRAVARCHVLDGLSRNRVAMLLGRGSNHRRASVWTYDTAISGDPWPFGLDQTLRLTVRFGADDRVAHVRAAELTDEPGQD